MQGDRLRVRLPDDERRDGDAVEGRAGDGGGAGLAQVQPELRRRAAIGRGGAGHAAHVRSGAVPRSKKAYEIRERGRYPTKLYASSIAFDGEQGEKMRAVVEEILPYVDEHYWLPLYGMSGAAKAAGWKPKPGNPGRLDNMRSEPLPCWAVFTEAHVTADGMLAACCFGTGLDGGSGDGRPQEHAVRRGVEQRGVPDAAQGASGEGCHGNGLRVVRGSMSTPEPIRVFVGYDAREASAYHVCCQSIIENTTHPVAIHPLALNLMERFYAEQHVDGVNAFIYSRFLVPCCAGGTGLLFSLMAICSCAAIWLNYGLCAGLTAACKWCSTTTRRSIP